MDNNPEAVGLPTPDKPMMTPSEEIAYLRQQLASREQAMRMENPGQPINRHEAGRQVVEEYQAKPAEQVIDKNLHANRAYTEGVTLQLKPEKDDQVVQELFNLSLEKGVWNALNAVQKQGSPHLVDDFHRFLVAYLASTGHLPKLKPEAALFKTLDVKLFEISLPESGPDEQKKSARELVAAMEQFYAGMLSVAEDKANRAKVFYTMEIALSNDADHIVFYVAIPSAKVDLFEKQILAIYPTARILEMPDDYNIFNDQGGSAGAFAKSTVSDALSLKTFESMDHDPLDVVLNVFSKLKTQGEGAAIQIIVRPAGEKLTKQYGKVIDGLEKGKRIKFATKQATQTGAKVASFVMDMISSGGKKDPTDAPKIDNDAIASVGEKIKSTIVETNIRVIASAQNETRSQQILRDVQSAFNQFTDTKGNGIAFQMVSGRTLQNLFKDYSFRIFSDSHKLALNLKELSTIYHFPSGVESAPQLKQATAKTAPAPIEAPSEGIFMGTNVYRNQERKVYMAREDRIRHFYVIGQTGTGKSYFLRNMIKQDIENGDGCCFIDPHGSDVQEILSYIPKERVDDLIYFDPSYAPRPMGLNMLEYDTRFPEQKTFVVDEMLGIFNKLFDMKTAGGPMFEQYFRNATMLVIEDPESGNTLLEISRVLADEKFRKMKLSRCKNPIVVQFWEEIAGKAGGEASLQNIVPYVTSKFDVFLSNEIMRPIVGQEKSAFNFREIMDNRKILLVNLSKGRLGEINANLLGLILVGKILMAALSRVDTPDLKSLAPFYLYIDEFQNVTTNSISQILSEARKYGLSLNVAHQFLAQLQDDIKNAVFGNVGSMGVFRISADDAKYLESRFEPTFSAADIMKIENRNYYLQMLGHGTPMKPFNVLAPKIEGERPQIVDKLKELSYLKYGRERSEVEGEIMAKYQSMKKKAEPEKKRPSLRL